MLSKLKSVSARKGTRHWDYGPDFDPSIEKKAIDPAKVYDREKEAAVVTAALGSAVGDVYDDFGRRTGEALGVDYNLLDRGRFDDLMERTNRLVGVSDTTWERVRNELIDGELAGEGIDGLSKRIKGVFGQASGYRARTIARTETIGAANAGSLRAAIQSDVVDRKTWLATVDPRTRASHVTADGQTVDIDKKFQVGASMMNAPGDPAGGPHETINCRCTLLFVRASTLAVDEDGEPIDEIVQTVVPEARGVAAATAISTMPGPRAAIGPEVRRGLGAVEKVHRVPEGLPAIPVKSSTAQGYFGQYSFLRSGAPSDIKITAPRAGAGAAERHVASTFVHEFGHYLDHQANLVGQVERLAAKVPGRTPTGVWGTGVDGRDNPLMAAFFEAIESSPTKLALDAAVKDPVAAGLTKYSGSTLRYYQSKVEIWARAYAQWIGTRAADSVMLEEIAAIRANVTSAASLSQWSPEEFEPIAKALDAIFRAAGLLIEEP